MISPVPGTHCEICLVPAEDKFHKHECKFFHGIEYICPACCVRLDEAFPRLVAYFQDTKVGCLFEEIKWAEERTGKKFERLSNVAKDLH